MNDDFNPPVPRLPSRGAIAYQWFGFRKAGDRETTFINLWVNEQQSTQLIGPDTRTIQGANRQKIDLLEQAIPLN